MLMRSNSNPAGCALTRVSIRQFLTNSRTQRMRTAHRPYCNHRARKPASPDLGVLRPLESFPAAHHAVAFTRWFDTVEMNARRRLRRRRSRWYPIQMSRAGGGVGRSSLRIPGI